MGKTVAVLGASADRRKFGNKAVRAHERAGYEVYPINLNPAVGTIEGRRSFARLGDVPEPIQRVVLYLPPPVTLELLPEISAARPKEVWLNPGTYDSQVLRRAEELELPVVEGCSIVDLGMSPSQFPA